MSQSRLYRSTTTRAIGGVAGGIAEFFDIDPVIIRIIFVFMVLFGGSGVLIYLVLWIAVPEKPVTAGMFSSYEKHESGGEQPVKETVYNDPASAPSTNRMNGSILGGVLLIGVGVLILAGRFIPRIDFGDIWPLILVMIGVVLIATSMNQTKFFKKSDDKHQENQ